MSKQCPFCIEARAEAAKQVYKWLVCTTEPIPQNRANYLQAYIRLGHRIDLAEGHTLAGRILEKMLDSHETWGLYEADGLDEDLPIEYPGDIEALLTMVEKKVETDE
jgi:hypothetical protein